MARGKPWSKEEDELVLTEPFNADTCLAQMKAAGFQRTKSAVYERRKKLKMQHTNATNLAAERARLEDQLVKLQHQVEENTRRIAQLKIEQAKELFGDIEVPEELIEALQRGA